MKDRLKKFFTYLGGENLILLVSLTFIILVVTNYYLSAPVKYFYQDLRNTTNFNEFTNRHPWIKNYSDISYVRDPIDDVYKPVLNNTELIGFKENGGVLRIVGSEELVVIPVQGNDTLVGSLSPNRKYFIYNMAKHPTENEFIEGPVHVFDIENRTQQEIASIPEDLTFSGAMLWSEDSDYLYYILRSSTKDLHYPDPETTLFYLYDVNKKENKFLGKGSDFVEFYTDPKGEKYSYYVGGALIFGESLDKKYYYIKVVGHGDNSLFSVWKINRETLEPESIYDYNTNQHEFGFKIRAEELSNERLILDEQDNGFTGNRYTLDLITGELERYIETDYFSYYRRLQKDNKIYANDTSGRLVYIFDEKNDEKIGEIDITGHGKKISLAGFTEAGEVVFYVAEDKENGGWFWIRELLGIYNTNTQETRYVPEYKYPYDGLYSVST